MPSTRKPKDARPARKTAPARATARPKAKRAAPHKERPAATAEAGAAPVEAAPPAPAPRRRPAAGGRTIVIVQYASGIGCPVRQKRVLKALGLRHPHHRVVRPDNPAVRGMVAAVTHLARIEEVQGGA